METSKSEYKPRLALDLDGVFADCDGFIQDYFGHHYYELGGDYIWQHMTHDVPNIFYHFKKLPFVEHLLSAVKPFEKTHDVFFLTAIPRPTGYLLTSGYDKERWVREQLKVLYPVNCVMGRQLKQLYVNSVDDILIDDHPENIKEWTDVGGYGILHTDIFKTIEKLNLHAQNRN